MSLNRRFVLTGLLLAAGFSAGCQSPYYADRGAGFGAVTGGALGAIVGQAAGKNPLAGAAVGAMAGAVTGTVVGSAMDDQEARNRAAIEAQMGRQVRVGTVSKEDVIAMSHAGVADELIVTHIRSNGFMGPLSAGDLILLKDQNVSPRVVQAMQAPPPQQIQQVRQVVVQEPPVIVEPYYGPHYYRPYYPHRHCYPRRGGVSYGVSISN